MTDETTQLSAPLRMRRDVAFLQTEKGILFRTRKGSFSLHSRTIYRSFRQLLPHLEGKSTGEEVIALLRPAAQAHTRQLLKQLLEHEVLQSVNKEDEALANPSLTSVFSPQLNYLAHSTDRPVARFLAYRNSRILLLGDGSTLISVGSALLRNGLARVALGSEHYAATAALSDVSRKQAELGIDCAIDAEPDHDPADFDLVLYCSARPDLQALFALNYRAASENFVLLPALILQGSLMVGPLVQRGHSGCLQCAWLRWCEHLPDRSAMQLWQAVATGVEPKLEHEHTSDLQRRTLGNTAALEAFRLLVGGLEAESHQTLMIQALSTFESALRPLLPHPACNACTENEKEITDHERDVAKTMQEAVSVEQCVERWNKYTGEEVGYFSAFDNDDIEQLPLRISRLRYPSVWHEKQKEQTAVGWDVDDVHLSMLRAIQCALEDKGFLGAAHLLQTRLTYTPQPWQTLVKPHRIEGWLGISSGEEPEGWLEAWELTNNSPHLIPASAVHPIFHTGLFERVNAGVGAGRDTGEATRRALLSLAEGIALSKVADGTLVLHEWSEETPLALARSRYLRSAYMQQRNDRDCVYVSEPCSGIFTAFIANRGTNATVIGGFGCGSGFSPLEAVEEAWCERIARAQINAAGGDLILPPARLSALPPSGVECEISRTPLQWNLSSGLIEDMVAQLADSGYLIARLNLTPPDVALTDTMMLVKLLLVKRDEHKQSSTTISSSMPTLRVPR